MRSSSISRQKLNKPPKPTLQSIDSSIEKDKQIEELKRQKELKDITIVNLNKKIKTYEKQLNAYKISDQKAKVAQPSASNELQSDSVFLASTNDLDMAQSEEHKKAVESRYFYCLRTQINNLEAAVRLLSESKAY